MAINSYEYNHWDIEENTVLEDLAVQKVSDLRIAIPLLTIIRITEIEFENKWYRIDEIEHFEEKNNQEGL